MPVYFLTVAAGTRWVFRLAPTARASTDDVATAFELLERGLRYLGAGAKTAVGYGQMEPASGGQQVV